VTDEERVELILLERRNAVQYLSEQNLRRLQDLRELKIIYDRNIKSYNYEWEKRKNADTDQ